LCVFIHFVDIPSNSLSLEAPYIQPGHRQKVPFVRPLPNLIDPDILIGQTPQNVKLLYGIVDPEFPFHA